MNSIQDSKVGVCKPERKTKKQERKKSIQHAGAEKHRPRDIAPASIPYLRGEKKANAQSAASEKNSFVLMKRKLK